jgi:hypothetical protein
VIKRRARTAVLLISFGLVIAVQASRAAAHDAVRALAAPQVVTGDGQHDLVRFVFFDMTPNSFRFEQAFSDDWGKTWEAHWKATFTR